MDIIPMTVVEEARAQHNSGDYAGAWRTLAAWGDTYADNAAEVVGRPQNGWGDLFGGLVENHWDNTAGEGAYEQKFQSVARDFQDSYLDKLETNGGIAPNTKDIEQFYREAVVGNGLPPEVAIDGVITGASKNFGDFESPWAPLLDIDPDRIVPSDVFKDIDPLHALDTLGKDIGDTLKGLIGDPEALARIAGALAEKLKDIILPTERDVLDGLLKIGNALAGLGNGIGQSVSDLINAASAFTRRVDPLTLDLDGDGLETVGIDPNNPILFDHDGDGIKTATGWVAPDDGFLVLDRNGNGLIDNGTELFGDSTPLYGGGTAVDGFASLAQEDTNADGRVDANDARFADLRIWRDLNQNGISEAGELITLQDAGIVSLHTGKTENAVTLPNGNQIADLGGYVKADGSTGAMVEIAGELGDINLIEDTFHSQFSDSIPLTETAKTLPQMNGSGQVRNLREAASLSTGFATLLQTYDTADTRDAQEALLDDLVQSWGETSTLAVTGQGAYDGRQVTVVFSGVQSGTPEYDAWMHKLNTLERFNGHAFFTNLPAGSGPVAMGVSPQSMALLDQAYAALKDSVYDSLILQTRLEGIVNGIDLVLENDTLRLDLTGAEQEMMNRVSANAVNGMTDALEFIDVTRTTFDLATWDVYGFMGELLRTVPDISSVRSLLNEFGWYNLVLGGGTASTLNGSVIDDIMLGGNGNDNLIGNAGSDVLHGDAGADRMEGGQGDDVYWVDNAGDTIIESANSGTDTVYSSIGYSLAGTNLENLTLIGTVDIDGTGNGDDNILVGNDGANTLSGGNGNDTLDGGLGADTLTGGVGSDTYIINDTEDLIVDAGGSGDTVKSSISYVLDAGGTLENLILAGTANIDGIGNSDDNILTGNSGNNTLTGQNGSDTLDGGAGADTLIGGESSDTYVVDDAGDVVVEVAGEGGNDTVQSSVSYTLTDNVEHLTLTGSTAINGTGNTLNNTIIGNVADNILDGGIGNDTLQGGAGNDIYKVNSSSDNIVELAGEGVDSVESTSDFTLDAEVENLALVEGSAALTGNGNGLDNRLIGNSADNILDGKDGNDFIDGGVGADDMYGGYGDDIFIVDNAGDAVHDQNKKNIGTDTEPVWIDGGMDTVYSSVSFTLSSYVEKLVLTGAEPLNGTGDSRDNILIGNAASNTLSGMDGNDVLDGGLGADALIGGKGDDTFIVDDAGDVVTEVSGQGTDTVVSSFSYNLSDTLENLTLGGTADINGTGNNANNILTGNEGVNVLTGKLGNDTYYVQNTGDVVVELASEGTDIVYATASYLLGANVENLTLIGDGNINGTGNSMNNTITGNTGNNMLDGSAGNDTLVGGAGNDTYIIDNSSDKITELAGQGSDTVQVGFTYTLGAELENLTLIGTANINGTGNTSNNVLIGNAGNNTLSGGDGNDTLTGGSGADTLKGGLGDDIYLIDDLSDTLSEVSSAGIDTVQSSLTYTLLSNFENLVLSGMANLNGTGNSANNVLTGNSGNNTLSGLNGNDTLDGGAGADTLIGGSGNDIYVVDNAGDVVTEASGAGTDTVQSFIDYTLGANLENLTLLGSVSINGTGNSGNNVITGNSGDNVLNGGGGTDIFLGGWGDDIYIVDSGSDIVTENAGEGIDTVQTGMTYTLGANIENLVLTGTSAINGTGNDLDNYLIGNSANNTLNGGLGNDMLDGGTGTDVLKGNAGDDTYVVDAQDSVSESGNEGIDTVLAAHSYTLGNNLENLTLTGNAAINGTGNTLNNVLTGNGAANTLSGLGGNDTLNGGGGADLLDGGAGNDTYVFGRGDGADVIQDYQTTSNTDILSFGADISAEQIWFRQSGNDLVMNVIGTQDSVTVKDWYSGSAYHVEQFVLADGEVLLDTQVQALVNAMASFAPPAAGQTTLPQNYQDALSGVIAVNWQ